MRKSRTVFIAKVGKRYQVYHKPKKRMTIRYFRTKKRAEQYAKKTAKKHKWRSIWKGY